MKPSRKERKRLADIKRAKYAEMVADEATRLTKSKPFNEHWVLALDIFIRDLMTNNPLEAHLIRQGAKNFEKELLKTIKE